MGTQYLKPEELAARYRGMSPKTLANWRSQGKGPPWIKTEGRVYYELRDVVAWERSRRRPAALAEEEAANG